MTKIGLISDTHSFLDEAVFKHFENCDEIWHAGDFGNMALVDKLAAFKPLRGVYGNIDGKEIRQISKAKESSIRLSEAFLQLPSLLGRPCLLDHQPGLF